MSKIEMKVLGGYICFLLIILMMVLITGRGVQVGEKGVRSYSGQVIGDSMSLTFNFRFLINAVAVFGTIIYGFYKFQSRIQELERQMEEADQTIAELLDKHMADEQIKREELEEKVSFYEKEFNINPLSWGKRKKKK